MHTRLPDFTFTSNPVFGYIPMTGQVQPSPSFSQGEDAFFTVVLSIDGELVLLEKYSVAFLVKKWEEAANTLIRQQVTDSPSPGTFNVLIPAAATALLRPGTYYFAFVATNRVTKLKSVISRGTFNIDVTVASPNPALLPGDGELTADGDSLGVDATIPVTEATGPSSPDISVHF